MSSVIKRQYIEDGFVKTTLESVPVDPSQLVTDIFSGYHTVVIALTEAWQDLTIGAELKKTSGFSHAADSAEVVVNLSGDIEISAHVTVDTESPGQERFSFLVRVVQDNGGGYFTVVGSEIVGYMRKAPLQTVGESTVSMTPIPVAVNNGDKLKIQVVMDDGSTDNGIGNTVANKCVFTMKSLCV